ncbi:IS66 family transposase [Mesorhizobium silamurunense]|uniref:IS66 family transposase n=1 Tax=Mesorhizobium silamurunense TaxID=499528 RepID=UPI001785B05B|nr:transposase [Mesorhizobium silamurunense]
MAAKGVDIERSTLARSAGYAAALLDPIYNRIREIGRTRTKIHTDDTRLPILAPGKTHKGALWVYVADDATRVRRSRQSPGIAPPWAAPARAL